MIIAGATAYPRLIDFAVFREIADEVGAWLMVDAAHFIGLVAGRAIPSPVPYADVVTFTTHKVLRGPRGGMLLCRPELAARIDKAVFPFSQGGPLMHAVAAKAVALKEALQPEYRDYARQVIANAQALAAGLEAEGMRPVSGGTDTHLALLDLRDLGVTRHRGGAALRRGRDHPEQERHPLRPAAADDRLRHPRRHPGGHDPGHGRGGDGGGRGADRGGGPRRRRQRDGGGPGVGRDARVASTPPTRDRPDRVREYLLTPVVAAAVTYLLTPGRTADRAAVGSPDAGAGPRRARDPDATAGRRRDAGRLRGRARWSPTACRSSGRGSSAATSRPSLSGAVLICLLGVADDRWELDAVTKLAGQVLAAGVMVLQGVQMLFLPFGGLGGESSDGVPGAVVLGSPRGRGADRAGHRRDHQRGQLRRRARRAGRRHRGDRGQRVLRLLLPAGRAGGAAPRDDAPGWSRRR